MANVITQKAPDARGAILRSAFREMHLHGFQAASVGDILSSTGLTKGALYHHFPTKQVLGLAVVDEFIRAKFELLIARLREGDGIQPLFAALRGWVRDFDADSVRLGCPLNNLLNEMAPIDERFREKLLGLVSGFHAAVEDALRRSQRAGDLAPSADCHAVAWFIVSSWQGATGISKIVQSKQPMLNCIGQLEVYIGALKPAEGARHPAVSRQSVPEVAEHAPVGRPSVRMDED